MAYAVLPSTTRSNEFSIPVSNDHDEYNNYFENGIKNKVIRQLCRDIGHNIDIAGNILQRQNLICYVQLAPLVELLIKAKIISVDVDTSRQTRANVEFQINAEKGINYKVSLEMTAIRLADSGPLDYTKIDQLWNANVQAVPSASTSMVAALVPVAPLAPGTTLLQLLKDKSGATAFLKRFDTSA